MTSALRHPVLQLAPKHPPPPVVTLSKPAAVLTSSGKTPSVGVPSKLCNTFASVIATAKRPLASSPLLKKKCVARAGAEGSHAGRGGSPRSVASVPTASAAALASPASPAHTTRSLLSSSRLPRIASRATPPSPATPRTQRGGGGGGGGGGVGGSGTDTEQQPKGKERRLDAVEQVKSRKNERNSLEKANKGKSTPQVVPAPKQAHKRKQSKESCDIPNKGGPASKGPTFKSHLSNAPFPTQPREKPGRGSATKQEVTCKFPAIIESPGQGDDEGNLAMKTSSVEDAAQLDDNGSKELSEVRKDTSSLSASTNMTPLETSVLRCRTVTDLDRSHGASRPVSPCRSDLSSASDQSHVSNLSRTSRISTRRRLVALQNAKAGPSVVSNVNAAGTPLSSSSCGGPPRRDSRVYCGGRSGISTDKIRKKSEVDCKTKLEKIKGPKSHKLPPSKASDSTKALKPGPRTSQQHDDGASRQQQHEEVAIKQQLHEETANRKQLHEQLVKQLQVASKAQKERDVAERSVEALTVLVHYLTQQYDAFSMPWVKSQVLSLTEQLARVHLSLDESYAANKRFQEEIVNLKEQHEQYTEQLKNQHKEQLEEINEKHKTYLLEVKSSHRNELEKFAKDQEEQLKTVALQQKQDLQQLETKWQKSVEEEYERHVKALQQAQGQHVQELNDLKSEHLAQESHWQDVNRTLTQEKENLKQQASKLEETLLNDADYRLQAVRKMCAGLQNEVDSMKMVVDMRNTEIHELRNQVGQMARLTEELEATREKVKALQAKNEDLKAQMEKKALYERQLMNERRQLAENYQKESNVNKRLSLENEELQWKLRQREDAMSASFSSTGSTSTLDLLTRSPSVGRRHEGSLSPQVPPRSPRLSQRPGGDTPSSSRVDVAKRRGQLGMAPNLEEESLHSTLESPPPSPCVKAVVEKSNSVSFILDLNESQSDDSFLDLPASPRPRPTRTASLGKADRAFRGPCKTRKALLKSKSNASDRNGILGSLCGRFEIVKVDSRPQSSSESEHGSELENARQSPTGVAWTVPINQSSENPAQTDMQNDESQVFSYAHQKEQSFYHNQIEDEYEEMKDGTHQFIEVVELRGRHCFKTDVLNLGSDGKLEMNKLNIMTSSSEGTSESEMSQCDIIKVGTSSESESDSSEDDHLEASLMDDVSLTSHDPLVGSKGNPWCPKEGAGEAMVTDELLSQYNSDALTMDSVEAVNTPPCSDDQSLNPHRRLSYGPSSDSEGDTPQLETNDAANVDISWSEDVECDITSSSEMHEI